ncbi:glycosyltransferase family 4 protein [Rhodopseudomonas palustris]|uniref:glycosyltransferase family 4 protein n=1 Tax=Rhodopseudomonas palustris TaxID=1076 RepID=UPI003A5BFC49
MPRIILLATEDWSFVTYRMPIARAAIAAGYDVHVVTRVDRHRRALESEGLTVHPINFRRGSSRLDHLARAILSVRGLYNELRPDIVHHFAVQAVVVGSLAATGLRLPIVNSLTGLGTIFTSARGIGPTIVAALLPKLLSRAGSITVVQNADDQTFLGHLGVPPQIVKLVAGSGVDIDRFTPIPEPDLPPTIAYVGRMLEDKGLRSLIEAHRRLRSHGIAPNLLLAGTPDPLNPSSISEAEVRLWSQEPGITWLGHVDDVTNVWREAHIAVLPSRREGLPMSLLEAAACGRALIASDVPGCRAAVRSGVNGLLFPFNDADALATAIVRLFDDPNLRRRFGQESRRLAVEEFSAPRIGREVVEIYQRLLANYIR